MRRWVKRFWMIGFLPGLAPLAVSSRLCEAVAALPGSILLAGPGPPDHETAGTRAIGPVESEAALAVRFVYWTYESHKTYWTHKQHCVASAIAADAAPLADR